MGPEAAMRPDPVTLSGVRVAVPAMGATLRGSLTIPADGCPVVVFAHGGGTGRHSRRNVLVAAALNEAGLGTLLVDLLTPGEEEVDRLTDEHRFDVALLARRLIETLAWIGRSGTVPGRIGLFGASTGAAAVLAAAAARPDDVAAVVLRSGRPDLAAGALPRVRAPTLLIAGDADVLVRRLNRRAAERLTCEKRFVVVPGATRRFQEPGALEEVARVATDWFCRHLGAQPQRAA
jgi:pimeloyl-ACP methyl ester carboxylesterase